MGKLMGGISADEKEALRKCVLRGADRLDAEAEKDPNFVPKNWRTVINIKELDLADPYFCVLGQVARNNNCGTDAYGEMAYLMEFDVQGAAEHGFVPMPGTLLTYEVLTVAWKQYLEESQTG